MFGLVRLTEEEKSMLRCYYAELEKDYVRVVEKANKELGPQVKIKYTTWPVRRLQELGIPFKYTKINGIEPTEK